MKITRHRFRHGVVEFAYDMRHLVNGERRCQCPVCSAEVDPDDEFLTYPYCTPCYERAFGPLHNNEPSA